MKKIALHYFEKITKLLAQKCCSTILYKALTFTVHKDKSGDSITYESKQ